MQEEHNKIEKFIRDGIKPENASSDFSNNVMHQINVMEKAREKALITLLQKHTLQETSLNFTEKVLLNINSSLDLPEYQPVIRKKVWFLLISILISVLIYIASFIDSSSNQIKIVNESLLEKFNLFSFNLSEFISSPILALSLFALSTLLFLDYYLRNRRYS